MAASCSISCCYWRPSQRPKAVVAASYLTSGGGAKAVLSVLLYLPLLLVECRGGILLYLLLLLEAFSATEGRRGGFLPDV